MYKSQLQELAQRCCFNLPSYTRIREGPDHAPRFKAVVKFNGETFESPSYCCTLRHAEHSAAKVALNALSSCGPFNSLAGNFLDETGVYKNLLQQVSQKVGAPLPAYTTFRTSLSHPPIFTCTIELVGVIFTGEPAKTKKQAEKKAAMAAWLSLKSLVQPTNSSQRPNKDEQEQVIVARALQKYLIKARLDGALFPIRFPMIKQRPSNDQPFSPTTSRILPLIWPKTAPHNKLTTPINNNVPVIQKCVKTTQSQSPIVAQNESCSSLLDNLKIQPQKFPAAGATPYIPFQERTPHYRVAQPVMIRNNIPVFSAPPLFAPRSFTNIRPLSIGVATPVCRQVVSTFAAPPVLANEFPKVLKPIVNIEEPTTPKVSPRVCEKSSFGRQSYVEEPL